MFWALGTFTAIRTLLLGCCFPQALWVNTAAHTHNVALYFLISICWKSWVHASASSSNPNSAEFILHVYNSFFWHRGNCLLLPLTYLLWSVFLKATILLSSHTDALFSLLELWLLILGCPFLQVDTPYFPEAHTAQIALLSSGLKFPGLAAFSLTSCGHPLQPACALNPMPSDCSQMSFSPGSDTLFWVTECMDCVLTALRFWLPWLNHLPNVYTLLTLWVLIPHGEQPHHGGTLFTLLGPWPPHQASPWGEIPPWAMPHVLHFPQPIQALTPPAWQLSYSPSPSCLALAPCSAHHSSSHNSRCRCPGWWAPPTYVQ